MNLSHSAKSIDDSAQENSGESRDRKKGSRLRMKEHSRDPGSMDEKGYAIKLYGQGSGDPKQFCYDLARILSIPADEAEELLNQVPVVLKQGMRKTDALVLHRLLQSIDAWHIVEAADGEFCADEMPEKPIRQIIAEDLLAEDVSNQGHPRLWLGIMLGLPAFLGLFILVGLLSYMGSMRDSIGTKKPVTIQSDQPEVSENSENDSAELESPDIIRARHRTASIQPEIFVCPAYGNPEFRRS